MRALVRRAVLAVFGLALLIQLVPYGRAHANPRPGQEPAWATPQTRALAQRACFDCHSSRTQWPWYSNVAPVSWLVQHDVDEGREKLNFDDPNRLREARDAAETVLDGEMPLRVYLILHPEARLTGQEQQELAQGLAATFGGRVGRGEGRARGRD
jgi:mono/diheme cytochrome c family protein